jgi:hypothetical protein
MRSHDLCDIARLWAQKESGFAKTGWIKAQKTLNRGMKS